MQGDDLNMEHLKNILNNLQCELVAERSRVNPQGINWLQYDILNILRKETKMVPSEISILLGISRTKLSKSLKELKIMDYVQQQPSKEDGRELITFLSKEGEELLTEIDNGHSHLFQVANSIFDDKEQEEFIKLSEKYIEALKKERLKNYE